MTAVLPSEIETLDQRHFYKCRLIRAEADALLIRHQKGIARLSFSHLDKSIRERFNYDPERAFEAATRYYEKEKVLRRLRFQEEKFVREIRKAETIKTSWIAAEATVIRTCSDGAYVAAMRILWDKSCPEHQKRILVPLGPSSLFIQINPENLRPGSLWKGYICPHPDDTVLDLDGEMFTVPKHKAYTVACENTGGS